MLTGYVKPLTNTRIVLYALSYTAYNESTYLPGQRVLVVVDRKTLGDSIDKFRCRNTPFKEIGIKISEGKNRTCVSVPKYSIKHCNVFIVILHPQ